MYTDNHFSLVFSSLIKSSYELIDITLEIKRMITENKLIDETTTFK